MGQDAEATSRQISYIFQLLDSVYVSRGVAESIIRKPEDAPRLNDNGLSTPNTKYISQHGPGEPPPDW